MTINLQTGAGYVPAQPMPVARSADIQVGQKQPADASTDVPAYPTANNSTNDPALAEQRRYEHVVMASQKMAYDAYPVSDKSFTIYKDASGQYITRYTSLRDGRVTYVPEPKLLQMFESSQRSARASVVAIQA